MGHVCPSSSRVAAVAIGGTLGMRLGCGGGIPRWTDRMRSSGCGDMQLAFPTILFAIAIIAVLGPSFIT